MSDLIFHCCWVVFLQLGPGCSPASPPRQEWSAFGLFFISRQLIFVFAVCRVAAVLGPRGPAVLARNVGPRPPTIYENFARVFCRRRGAYAAVLAASWLLRSSLGRRRCPPTIYEKSAAEFCARESYRCGPSSDPAGPAGGPRSWYRCPRPPTIYENICRRVAAVWPPCLPWGPIDLAGRETTISLYFGPRSH